MTHGIGINVFIDYKLVDSIKGMSWRYIRMRKNVVSFRFALEMVFDQRITKLKSKNHEQIIDYECIRFFLVPK